MFDSILRAISRSQSESNINNQVKLYNDTLPTLVNSEIEEVVNNISTFEEAFPNYDPNIPIIPVKILNYFNNILKDSVSDILSSSILKIKDSGVLDILLKNSLQSNSLLNVQDKVPSHIVKAIEDSNTIINQGQPLGEIGDITINQLVNQIISGDLSTLFTTTNLLVGSAQIITVGLVYKLVVNSYANLVFPMSSIEYITGGPSSKAKWLEKRAKNIKIFMLFAAPILTLALCKGAKMGSTNLLIEKFNDKIEESILLLATTKKFINKRYISSSSNTKNNNTNLKKYVWFGIFNTILLYIIFRYIDMKYFFFIYTILGFMYIIYLFIELLTLILFINKKITVPSYLPSYLTNWLLNIENIDKAGDSWRRAYIDLEIKNILVIIVTYLVTLIVYMYIF